MLAVVTDIDARVVIVSSLAIVEDTDPALIEAQITQLGGDDSFFLDSKFAEAIIGYVEAQTGRQLRGPADLLRSQYSTIRALVDELNRQLS